LGLCCEGYTFDNEFLYQIGVDSVSVYMGKTTLNEFFSVNTLTKRDVVKHAVYVKFLSLVKEKQHSVYSKMSATNETNMKICI